MKKLSIMSFYASFILAAILLALPASSFAHGFAGKRFFPTTFAVEDPFVTDEFSLLANHIQQPGEDPDSPPVRFTSLGMDFAKRITPHLGFSIGEELQNLNTKGEGTMAGFSNVELGLKYQFLTSEEHEAILSVGTSVEVGGTGDRNIGSESFSVWSPALSFGKGMGDLPDSLDFAKPFAITGVLGPNLATGDASDTFTWAFSLQYSLIYLQSFVKDVGLGDPFKRMVLVLEFPMETGLNGEAEGHTTGTINPGIVWCGKYVELGLAAEIPINDRTGHNVGVFGLVHIFVDDLFPNSLGRPLFNVKGL